MYIITYIMVTMVTGKLQVVEYLIVRVEAVPVARDSNGLTTLHAATSAGHLRRCCSSEFVDVTPVYTHTHTHTHIQTHTNTHTHTHTHTHPNTHTHTGTVKCTLRLLYVHYCNMFM